MTKCLECGATENIHQHHTDYEEDVTVPLCASCHRKVHGDKDHEYYPKEDPVRDYKPQPVGRAVFSSDAVVKYEKKRVNDQGQVHIGSKFAGGVVGVAVENMELEVLNDGD